jgi:DNA-binding IclR family transcriptional regulator
MPYDGHLTVSGSPSERTILSGPHGRIQSVARALALLDFIGQNANPVRAADAAAALNLNISTVHHLLATLIASGYIRRDGRRYQISAAKLTTLGAWARREIHPPPIALQLMRRLAEETGETAFVACWDGADVVIAATTEGRHAVRVASLSVGSSGDGHARASGKALLAQRPNEDVERYLSSHGMRALTPRTIIDAGRFHSELAIVRQQGYAVDQEEFLTGVWCIAAPLLDGTTPATTAISISMPTERYLQMRDRYVELILELARSPAPEEPTA